MIAGCGLGLLVSQLNNYTLSPISEERVSEAAGVNSAAGSFGLSFGLAFAGAIMLATLSFAFTNMADDSKVLSPAEQQQVSDTLEHDAEVMSNTRSRSSSSANPRRAGRDHPHQHRARPRALQVALLVPIVAALLGALRLVPHDAPAGSRRERGRGDGARLTSHAGTGPAVPFGAAQGGPTRTVAGREPSCP